VEEELVLRVLACLTTEHDPWLLALAVGICGAAALTALALHAIACRSTDHRRIAWSALAGVCAGTGIWSTHFVAMLAYQVSLPIQYEPVVTAQSLLLAVGISALGFGVAAMRKGASRLWGGAIVGLAIATMHFWGMQALVVPGELIWDSTVVTSSIAVGIILASAALAMFDVMRGQRALLLAACCFVLAVCALHFTAMAAVIIVPDPTIEVAAGLNKPHLAMAVAAVTFVVILCAWAAILLQQENLRFETLLRDQNEMFEAAIQHLPVALSLFDARDRLIMCNPAYRRLYGAEGAEGLLGRTFSDVVLEYVGREQGRSERAVKSARAWIDEHMQRISGGQAFSESFKLPDGRTILKRVGPISRGGWVDVQEDVTPTIRATDHLAWAAQHDALTGIANRLRFRQHLEEKFKSYRPSAPFALHWIDLDHFKEINDKLGHQVGDEYLKCMAKRLATSLRADDVIGRLGGDEFAVLQGNVHDAEAAQQFAERLLANLRGPYDVVGHQLTGAASIGIALAPQHGETPDQLFASADIALYAAKGRGRGAAALYEAGLEEKEIPNPLADELRQAVANGELLLHYQPIIDLKAGRICGFEALMRWKHPRRGTIPPSEFIPLAEQSGLIVGMGAWAIEQACQDARGWPNDISVSVNLSTRQIEDGDVCATVGNALAASGLAARRLELEITETALLRHPEQARRVLSKLHQLGVRLALDDFGTCFSNLSYLRVLPVSTVKIDRSFVEATAERPGSRAILAAVAELAAKLGLRAVAEGVETEAGLAAIRDAGYQHAQGFYFSLPVPASSVARTLARCQDRLEVIMLTASRAA
jgi:diguanylate cyclase (GGDEF)-like protein/PAS domain S-box-containing protein